MGKYNDLSECIFKIKEKIVRLETENDLLKEYLGVAIVAKPFDNVPLYYPMPTQPALEELETNKLTAIMDFLDAEFHTQPASGEKTVVRAKTDGK